MLFLLISVEIDKSTLSYKTKKHKKKYYYKIWVSFAIRDLLCFLAKCNFGGDGKGSSTPSSFILFTSLLNFYLANPPFLPVLNWLRFQSLKPEAGLVQTDCFCFRCLPPSSFGIRCLQSRLRLTTFHFTFA